METLDQIKERNDPDDSILITNMESNRWEKIVRCNSNYRYVQPLTDTDVILNQPKAKGAGEA